MDPSHAAPDEQYSDFNFWRMPPNREVPSTDPGDDAQFNDFYFWRPPPPPCLNNTEMDCSSPVQPRPASPGGHGTPPPMDMPESGSSRPTRREWLEVEEDDAMDDDDDEHPMSAAELLSGGAGARLVGLLGQLTQHLGSSSRFSRAAGLLQQDMLRQRELVQQTNAARIAPLEGSTLQQPEVLSSVGSLLSVLQQTDTHVQTLATPLSAARAGAPLQLFVDGVDAAMPPPSPASPEALATLAPPTSRFALDAPSTNCTICLEALDDPAGALQMPCAKQHVFHRECLLKWMEARNTCPICRHSMPTAQQPDADGESEAESAPAERIRVNIAPAAEEDNEWTLVAAEEQTEPPNDE